MQNNLNERQQKQLKELSKQMSEEILALMKYTGFPGAFIHPKFQDWLTVALPHETAMLMKTSYTEFKKFFLAMNAKKVSELNMWEMGFAINCIESKSQAQLKANTPDIYISIQDAISEMCVRWNEVKDGLTQPIADKYNELAKKVRSGKQIIIPKIVS